MGYNDDLFDDFENEMFAGYDIDSFDEFSDEDLYDSANFEEEEEE